MAPYNFTMNMPNYTVEKKKNTGRRGSEAEVKSRMKKQTRTYSKEKQFRNA